MYRFIKTCFLLVLGTLLFTSCLEITEKVKLNNNGSGTYGIKVDMSGLKSMIAMLQEMSDEKIDEDSLSFGDTFLEVKDELTTIKGISNFKNLSNEEDFIFGFQFDFRDMEALNKALNKANEKKEGNFTFFSYKNGLFERKDPVDIKGEIMEEIDKNNGLSSFVEPGTLFKEMNYTTIYTFDKEVKGVSNDLATLSEDKQTVTTKYYFFEDEEGSIANKITF